MLTFIEILQMLAALAVTLGLFGLAVWAMRRYGPNVTKRFQAIQSNRRMTVVETLSLDTKARLVLVRIDDGERLVLIGEGRLLETVKKARGA